MAWTKAKPTTFGAMILAALAGALLAVHYYDRIRFPDYLSKDALAKEGNDGYQTPEAALKTLLWAMTQANYPAIMASTTPEQRAKMENELKDDASKHAFIAKMKSNAAPVTGFRITSYRAISADAIVIDVRTEGVNKTDEWTFRKIGDEWKFGG